MPIPPPDPAVTDLPTFFIDRSLGRIRFPNGLRSAGLHVVTLAEHYGVPADERVADVEWLDAAGRRGWVVLKADTKIRTKNPVERRALIDAGVRAFVINGNLRAAAQIERVLANLAAIARACRRQGPFVYRIHPDRIERLRLRR